MSNETLPRIPEWLAGKDVFVTGVTGFMGKVLLEKLLRSCPDIGNIYVLIRDKKSKSAQERIDELAQVPLFDQLNKSGRPWIKKIIPIKGDSLQLNLGICEKDREMLKKNVSMVIHSAATVRFDEPLNRAVIMNIRGTREVCNLALEIEKLEVLVHISTTYSNTDQPVVEEKLYPAQGDWKKEIAMAENFDENLLKLITAKHIKHQPNTYTYTKSIAEHMVNDLCNGRIPTVILRPSIVFASLNDPFPGWIDNFNGPTGMSVACGLGLMKAGLSDKNITTDLIPVDVVIKQIIISAWWQATNRSKELLVLHASSDELSEISNNAFIDTMLKYANTFTPKKQLWYPTSYATTNKINYMFVYFFLQLLPAIFVDVALRIAGKKPMLVKIQRKLFVVSMTMSYFLTCSWKFKNAKMMDLVSKISPEDVNDFHVKSEVYNTEEYLYQTLLGGIKFLLKETDMVAVTNKSRIRKFYFLHKFVVYGFYLLMTWFVYTQVLQRIYNSYFKME